MPTEEGARRGWLNFLGMPLHIGVDAWNLTGDRRGIGRYVREIVSRWAQRHPTRLRLSLLVPERAAWFARRRYLQELRGLDLPVRHRSAERTLDVVWYPWNGMSWIASSPSVATLHDASLFTMAAKDRAVLEREQRPFRVAAAHARRIITDSQFSKDELVRHLRLEPDIIDVVHLGVDASFARNCAALQSDSGSRYLLFVGEPEARKGVNTLLRAMELLPQGMREETELVIAGASGQYALPRVPDSIRVRNIGWVDDAALVDVYAGAAALVCPSDYEGFGLPMIEAMLCGTPVVASDIPSHREAGANGALYVPVADPVALAAAIVNVLSQGETAQQLRQRGLARAKEMSWESTADKTLDSIERAVADATARR